jgi:hypothetical protein
VRRLWCPGGIKKRALMALLFFVLLMLPYKILRPVYDTPPDILCDVAETTICRQPLDLIHVKVAEAENLVTHYAAPIHRTIV